MSAKKKNSHRLYKCPSFLRDIIKQAILMLDVDRIYLFGSRARGDASSKSDYDLAFCFSKTKDESWPLFLATTQESAKTLLPLDLVNIRKINKKLKHEIEKEGRILYQKVTHE